MHTKQAFHWSVHMLYKRLVLEGNALNASSKEELSAWRGPGRRTWTDLETSGPAFSCVSRAIAPGSLFMSHELSRRGLLHGSNSAILSLGTHDSAPRIVTQTAMSFLWRSSFAV